MPKRAPSNLPMGGPKLPTTQVIPSNTAEWEYVPPKQLGYLKTQEELHDIEEKVKQLNTFLATSRNVEKLTVKEHKLLKKLLTEYKSLASILKQFDNNLAIPY